MESKINLNGVYKPSQDVVAREIQGEFLIIPVTSEISTEEGEIFTLNDTGKQVWDKLDGKTTLGKIIKDLSLDFDASLEELEADVLGFSQELFNRKMLVEVR